MAFLCVCPEKSLEFGADEKLHRCAKEQFIRGVLESVNFTSGTKAILTLPGGGIAVEYSSKTAPKIAIDADSTTLAALSGTIQNYAYLVKKYLQQELHLPAKVTLEAIRERMPVSETELLCKMYTQMGTGMISKLRGHFSFCIYDATTVRVLAGTDCSGSVPLVQGKLSDNSLFIASGNVYPGDAHDVEKIPAGHYKYGWHAGPVRFATPENEARHTAEEATSAANAALAGLFCKTADKMPKNRRASLDSANLGPSRKPNSRRGSLDVVRVGRHSMDSGSSKTRADGHKWWRSDDQEAEDHPPRSKTSKKNARKSKKKQRGLPSSASKMTTSAEELINKLGGAIREDSASVTMLMKLLEDSPCSLVVTKAEDESLVFVNKSFEEHTGYSSEEVLGSNCRFLQAPPGGSIKQSHGSKTLRRAIKGGQSCSVRIINYKKSGCPVLNDCSIVPLRDSEGNITHYVGMHTFQSLDGEEGEADSATAVQLETSLLLRSRSCGDMAPVGGGPSTHVTPTGSIAF